MKKFIIIFLFLVALSGLSVYYILFVPNVSVDRPYIKVEKELPRDSLLALLRPYLKSERTFVWAAQLKRFQYAKPGIYVIEKNFGNNDLINLFRSGRQVEIDVTFNNANSLEELAGKISYKIMADSLSLLKAFRDTVFLHAHGFTRDNALLMYIPDTYRFYYTTTAEDFRKRMWREYKRFWNSQRLELAKSKGLTPVEVGILASIVKKESVKKEEKPVIAGVYLNRLSKGMKLEADPTAVYAYKKVTGDTTLVRRVLKKHISVDSPYNTYLYPGLPPGPIAMPDIADIEAVLHAQKHSYLFFSADPSRPGYHVFSRTFQEHKRRANAYRRHLNERKVWK